MLDENVDGLDMLLRGKADLAMDVVNLKISKLGGLTKIRQARDLCVSMGIASTTGISSTGASAALDRDDPWGALVPGKPAVDYTAVKELKGSPDWQVVTVRLDELTATDPKVTAPLSNWQTVSEFSIGPSGATVRDGQKVKVEGKPWKGPRELRNLRWDGGE